MAPSPRRPAPVLLVLALAATSACGGGHGRATAAKAKPPAPATTASSGPARPTTSVTPLPGCQPVPPPGPDFSWLPKDLPMPPGTYAVKEMQVTTGAKSGSMVVPTSLTDFVRFALAQYPKAGWQLGRGDAERGEAEDNFAKGQQGGAWRIRQSFCDLTKSELFITFVSNVAAAPAPTFGPATTVPPGSTPTTLR